jgi:hypothetical protein
MDTQTFNALNCHAFHRRSVLIVFLATLFGCSLTASAGDWMTWRSSYTHDGHGRRVDQHSMPVQPVGPSRSDLVRSGFRHYRSTLQAGQSQDSYHVTEEWGRPVVPYEQWRFPFRPFGVPYDSWGPPTPYGLFLGGPFGFPFPAFPQGGHGNGGPGMGGPGMGGPGMGGPGWGGPGWGGPGMGGPGWGGGPWSGGNFGFPLQPDYRFQPWFDGTYPEAAPLDNTPDRRFFWRPTPQTMSP